MIALAIAKHTCIDSQEEAAMLRRALNESMRRVASLSSEGNVQVDRRIVVKLLVTFFEKGQSQEVLQLMARILAFTGTAGPTCLETQVHDVVLCT